MTTMQTKAHQIMPGRCKKSGSFEELRTESPDENHLYEEKRDGVRYLLQVRPNGARINYLTSRHLSVKTGLMVEKQDVLTVLRDHDFGLLEDTIFDGEICGDSGTSSDTVHAMQSGKVKYVVWDLLMLMGQDIRHKTLEHRRRLLLSTYGIHRKKMPAMMVISANHADGGQLLRQVLAAGGEGVVRKELDKPYGEGWTKYKGKDTFDMVVLGFDPSESEDFKSRGWIGSMRLGQWCSRKLEGLPVVKEETITGQAKWLLEFGSTSGFTKALRAKMSAKPGEYIGQVVEVACHMRLPSGRLRSPRFIRFRDDKGHDQCTYDPTI